LENFHIIILVYQKILREDIRFFQILDNDYFFCDTLIRLLK